MQGQTDSLNKFNLQGKKTGYWKVLLNENVDPIDSLKNAFFYGFELWDNGNKVFKFDRHWSSYKKITFDGLLPEKGKPQLITGTFKWYNKFGLLRSEEVYRNGQPVYFKSFHYLKNSDSRLYDKSDTIPQIFENLDFTKRYNNIPGTFYSSLHSFDGSIKEYWFRKEKNKWKSIRIRNGD